MSTDYKQPPIAFRIPADLGWRAVAVAFGEKRPDGLYPVEFTVAAVSTWGVAGHEVEPGEPTKYGRFAGRALNVGGSLFGMGGGVDLIPLDAGGQRLNAHRIVPPGGPDDETLLREAREWLAKFNEAAAAASEGPR